MHATLRQGAGRQAQAIGTLASKSWGEARGLSAERTWRGGACARLPNALDGIAAGGRYSCPQAKVFSGAASEPDEHSGQPSCMNIICVELLSLVVPADASASALQKALSSPLRLRPLIWPWCRPQANSPNRMLSSSILLAKAGTNAATPRRAASVRSPAVAIISACVRRDRHHGHDLPVRPSVPRLRPRRHRLSRS